VEILTDEIRILKPAEETQQWRHYGLSQSGTAYLSSHRLQLDAQV